MYQISPILLLSVCGYVWNLAFKGLKTFTVLSFHFSVYLVGYGKIGLNYFIFFQIDLHMFYLVILQ